MCVCTHAFVCLVCVWGLAHSLEVASLGCPSCFYWEDEDFLLPPRHELEGGS